MNLMSIFKQHLKREKFCHQSGLTLLELMLAIAIIGILASLAPPSFNRTIQQERMRLIVDTVISDLREASTLALSAGPGERITLEVANPGASWTYTVSHSSEGALVTRSEFDFSGDIALSVTSADHGSSQTVSLVAAKQANRC
jgi:prepilin-type N-terminal cleavage/methylation domain-containing protein